MAASSSSMSSSFSSLFSRCSVSNRTLLPNDSASRIYAPNSVKCDMPEPIKYGNGKPIIPIVNERTLPKFLESARLEKSVNRDSSRLKLFSGTANPALSQEIAWYMGLELGKINIKRFADGEVYVQLGESVRGCDVFLLQPTCPPVNENFMELQIVIDACRRASAKNITAVMPYFGYARADRKTQGRESIAAKLAANLITIAGADRVLACDIHSGQSIGYFDIPVDHVYCEHVILDYLASKTISSDDLVVVSPDVGGVARARAFAKKLSDAPLAIVDKRRQGHNVAEVMNLIGDVKGKVAVMVDDMIDTAGTISKGAALLHQEGAREVYACCTHAVFSPPAIERLSNGLFQEVIVTNTIPVAEKNYFPQLTVLSVANLLGETIWRVHDDCSVMNLIGDVKGKVAVMVDDMIDTAGAALLYQKEGEEGWGGLRAREVCGCCTHVVFSPPAIDRLSNGLFQEVIVTNTIPVAEKNYFPPLTVLLVANLLVETIQRVHDDCSASSIFQ